jgi:hypothetical protein
MHKILLLQLIAMMLSVVALTLSTVNILVVRPQEKKIMQLEAALLSYNIKLPVEVEKP